MAILQALKKIYTNIDTHFAGLLPGGAPVNSTLQNIYSKVDKVTGGSLPGGAPPVLLNKIKEGLSGELTRKAIEKQGGRQVDFIMPLSMGASRAGSAVVSGVKKSAGAISNFFGGIRKMNAKTFALGLGGTYAGAELLRYGAQGEFYKPSTRGLASILGWRLGGVPGVVVGALGFGGDIVKDVAGGVKKKYTDWKVNSWEQVPTMPNIPNAPTIPAFPEYPQIPAPQVSIMPGEIPTIMMPSSVPNFSFNPSISGGGSGTGDMALLLSLIGGAGLLGYGLAKRKKRKKKRGKKRKK